jgi:hypothetical protein
MAFRPSALLALRGFDEALGAGTPAQGGEDTLAFTRLLRAGHTTVYQASALTRHVHRTDVEGLRAQLRGYGRGLTAFYAALVLADPRAALPLVRLAPRALRDLTGSDGARAGGLGPDFPVELLRESRVGMLEGPRLYLRGRRAVRRELRRGRRATPAPG